MQSRPTLAVVALAVLCLALGVLAFPAAGDVSSQETGAWATRSARMEADLTRGDGSAEVTLRYRLVPRDPGEPLPVDQAVAVALLDFGSVATEEVTLEGHGRLVLWPTVGSRRAARIEPPLPTMGSERSDGSQELVFRYVVEGAVVTADDGVGLRVRIPVLTGPPVSAEHGETAFRATLRVPEGWAVTEGFPSTMDAEGDGRLVTSLRVVPSMVGFRGRADGTWLPGFPLVVDALTVVGLLLFAAFGWRHLRRVAS